MRLTLLCCLAALAVGCSGSHDDRAVLREGIQFGVSHKTSYIGPRTALRQSKLNRARWLGQVRKRAREHPNERFESPRRRELRQRLERLARTYDFTIDSVTIYRPRQLAPVIIVRSKHYLALAHLTHAIVDKLDGPAGDRLYEGFYFEARDERGIPFLAASQNVRGYPAEGGTWARSERLYPYGHF